MTLPDLSPAASHRPLRLAPGLIAGGLLVVAQFLVPLVVPGSAALALFAALLLSVVVIVWWLVFSRARWRERLAGLIAIGVTLALLHIVVHPSVANGLMSLMPLIFGLPLTAMGLVVGALFARDRTGAARIGVVAAAVLIVGSSLTLVRTGGITGEAESDLHWRWTRTPEERLLREPVVAMAPSGTAAIHEVTQKTPEPLADPPTVAEAPALVASSPAPPAWPGFRGPARDDVVRGVRIATDWSATPPTEIWRRPIGPGWSSFAVQGNAVFTQEQRGDAEVVSAYRLDTGEPIWMHSDPVRFYESNGGAGPRATPTLDGGRVYTLGATGLVNALDEVTGAVLWRRDVAADASVEMPGWGFAGSPLVVGDVVIVAASGRLVGYAAATGDVRWLGPEGGAGYSSPHLLTVDGVPQVLLLRGSRTIALDPATGALLWENLWEPGVSIVQPAMTPGGDVLIALGDAMGGLGSRLLAVSRGPSGWSATERWTSRGLKPYFNDLVVNGGYAYGFDASILACIDLTDGARKWKGGRYGHGQMLLLADQALLLVLSEEGELALVRATPEGYSEVARTSVLDGKTWNHPVLVGDVLLLRNGEEMAAYRLALADRVATLRE